MALIEWTRLEPGQVEALVAMFVNREHPESTRITPSRGDGGVDVLDRGAGPTGGDVVYQVKRYTSGFDAKQKAAVRDSWEALRTDPRWKGLRVEEWHLVMPWDPSPEAELWLQELAEDAPFPATWLGLTYVDQLAAKYPDVVDYYLGGGACRLREAQAEMLALMGLDSIAGTATSAPVVTDRVQRALGVLDHDPLYRFDVGFGHGPLPELPPPRAGLVMHMARETTDDGWITVDVIARCAVSAEIEPITIKGHFEVEPGTTSAQAIRDFVEFGAPMQAEDSFTGELAAPAGLGGQLTRATVKIGPSPDEGLGIGTQLHLEILDPDDAVVAQVDVDRIARSHGLSGGVRSVLREVNDVFELEFRWNPSEQTQSIQIHVGELTGLPVRAALPGIQFLTELKSPNRTRSSLRHAAPGMGVVHDNTDPGWREEHVEALGVMRRILGILTLLQDHASNIIRIPDFDRVTRENLQQWRVTVAMLQGDEVTGKIPEDHGFIVDLSSEIEVGESVIFELPWTVTVGDQLIELGSYQVVLEGPVLKHREPTSGGLIRHTFTTKGNEFKQRRSAHPSKRTSSEAAASNVSAR